MILAVLAVVLSCGLDTLAVATSIGLLGGAYNSSEGGSKLRGGASRMRVGLVFAAFEGLMPILGLFLGKELAGRIGTIAFAVGLVFLAVVGVYMLVLDRCEDKPMNLQGGRVLLAGLSVSLDELAVGFSFGLVRFPMAITAALLAAQAFIFAWIGITFGQRLRPILGEAAEKIAGVALILLALYLGLRQWVF